MKILSRKRFLLFHMTNTNLAQKMSTEDFVYLMLLMICIPYGHLLKLCSNQLLKTIMAGGTGIAVGLILIGPQGMAHSLVTIIINYAVIKVVGPRSCAMVSFIFVFAYLLFFRICDRLGFPAPPPYSNAVQLLVTLRTISCAYEVSENARRDKKDSDEKPNQSYRIKKDFDFQFLTYFSYCICYIGLLTGPFYSYRTFMDMIYQNGGKISTVWPAVRNLKLLAVFALPYLILAKYFPLTYLHSEEYLNHSLGVMYQLALLVPTFTWFRWRFYIAWILAEAMCIAAGLGAYPFECKSRPGLGPTEPIPKDFDPVESAKSHNGDTHDFETIHNIDIFGVELAPTMKYAMKQWNMTVQWWMATYVYKKMPIKSSQIKMFLLLFVSAFWHGVHPGYYLTFLSVPLVVIAETRMIGFIKPYLNETQSYWFDWVTWFCLYRSFEYTGVGFMLLKLNLIWKVWIKMYFIGHVFIFLFIFLPFILPRKKKTQEINGQKEEEKKLQ